MGVLDSGRKMKSEKDIRLNKRGRGREKMREKKNRRVREIQ
jgi:hypothetical protein